MLSKAQKTLLSSYAKKIVKVDVIGTAMYNIRENEDGSLTEAMQRKLHNVKYDQLERAEDSIKEFVKTKIINAEVNTNEGFDFLEEKIGEEIKANEGTTYETIYAFGEERERFLANQPWIQF